MASQGKLDREGKKGPAKDGHDQKSLGRRTGEMELEHELAPEVHVTCRLQRSVSHLLLLSFFSLLLTSHPPFLSYRSRLLLGGGGQGMYADGSGTAEGRWSHHPSISTY